MRTVLIVLVLLAASATTSYAQQAPYVNPHIRMDGTYVPGHYTDHSGGNVYFQMSPMEKRNPYTGLPNRELPYSNYSIHTDYPYYPAYYFPPEESLRR